MADPGAEAIVIGGIDDRNLGAHLFRAADKLSAVSSVNVLAGKWREKPGGAFEKIGVGKLHPGVLLARHGMPGKESLTGASPERFRSTLDNFPLPAADVGHQRLGQRRPTDAPDH